MEWNGKGMEMEFWRHTCGISPLEFCEVFINSTWNRSIKFHSIPWNSTFHLKMPTSAPPPNDYVICGWPREYRFTKLNHVFPYQTDNEPNTTDDFLHITNL